MSGLSGMKNEILALEGPERTTEEITGATVIRKHHHQ